MFPTVHDHARDKQVGRECVCVCLEEPQSSLTLKCLFLTS